MGDAPAEEIDYDNPPFPLTAIDRALLAMRDEDFHKLTWDDLQHIVGMIGESDSPRASADDPWPTGENKLEELKRTPSDLRRYLAWSHDVKQRYGGIVAYVIQERLSWTPTSSVGPPFFQHHSEIPFEDPRDYAILRNDWPYGFEDGIVHLLAWSKTPIAVDDVRGDVTPESRKIIEDFVDRTFVRELDDGRNRVMWFKNWVSLQSVRGVDHVHILVRDVPDDILERWTKRSDHA